MSSIAAAALHQRLHEAGVHTLLVQFADLHGVAKGKLVPSKPYTRVTNNRILSFAYPEVRSYYVKFFKQIAASGTKGIMIDLLRHPPIAAYEPIVTEAFKMKYGKDMEDLDLYKDPQIQELFSEYMRAFLVELRQAVGSGFEAAAGD